ncbi:MAG: hypothetical protein AAF702_10530 [Chloroflexota bacterium]
MYAKYHIETTQWVLRDDFSPKALRQVISANLSQDSVLRFLHPNQYRRHFCNNQISDSIEYVEEQHALIESLAQQSVEQVHLARELARHQRAALGRLLHTVQDFYSHTNYVDLWLSEQPARESALIRTIDGLNEDVLNHNELRTAHWFMLEILFYVPIIGVLLRCLWLPPHSHEAMHLDSPERGLRFVYSMIMAQQRTTAEYRRAVHAIAKQGGPKVLENFYKGE